MGEILIRSDPERIPQRFLHVPAESSGGIFSRPGRRSAPFRGSVGGIRIDPDVILHLRRCECVCVCVCVAIGTRINRLGIKRSEPAILQD